MSQKDYTIRIALASLLVIAMALPIGLFTLQESTRLDSQATSRQIINPGTLLPSELSVTPALTPQKSGFNHCQVGGCNGELCADPSTDPLNSICLWKEEFACYRSARCEIQASGRCGWTLTDELRTCLGDHANNPTQPPVIPVTPPPSTLPPKPTIVLPYYTPTPIPRITTIPPQLSSTPRASEPIACNLICPDSFILTSDCQCLPPERPQQAVNPSSISPPSLHPSTLPMAINQQFYLTQIELISVLKHSQLSVTVTGLPSGLSLTDCTPTISSFNRRLSTCSLSGMVNSQARTYPLVFTVSDNLGNNAIETRDLQVLSQQTWLDRLFLRLRSLTSFTR